MSELKPTLKRQLEEREITPSASAWDRLASQLEEQKPVQEAPKTPWTKWLAVAASVVLLAGCFIWFFNQNLPKTIEPTVVTTPVDEQEHEIEINTEIPVTENPELIENKTYRQEVNLTRTENKTSNSKRPLITEPKPEVPSQELKTIPLEIQTEEQEILIVNTPSIPNSTLEIEKLATADELLKNAIDQRRLVKNKGTQINSKQLLTKIEDELYQEKSSGMLDKLTDRLKSLQVAIAERNRQ